MAYSELVKDFENSREMIREFFLLGFWKRNDFHLMSTRTYDDTRRRIESWMSDWICTTHSAQGKQISISIDSRYLDVNPLFSCLQTKSFASTSMILYFCLMDILKEHEDGEALSFREICDELFDEYLQKMHTDWIPDDSTVRKKLVELVRLGLLMPSRKGKTVYYKLSSCSVPLADWKPALEFAREILPLGAYGYYLRQMNGAIPPLFCYKHHYLHQVLDSEVLEVILQCADQKSFLNLEIINKHQDACYEWIVYPLAVYVSAHNGRMHLYSWNRKTDEYLMIRLERIRKASCSNLKPSAKEIEEIESRSDELIKNVWGVSIQGKDETELEQLVMVVRIEKDEQFVLHRLEREKRQGILRQLDECRWEFSIKVRDSLEMIPWVRTFIGRIESLSCSNAQFEKRFWSDFDKMVRKYSQREPSEEKAG